MGEGSSSGKLKQLEAPSLPLSLSLVCFKCEYSRNEDTRTLLSLSLSLHQPLQPLQPEGPGGRMSSPLTHTLVSRTMHQPNYLVRLMSDFIMRRMQKDFLMCPAGAFPNLLLHSAFTKAGGEGLDLRTGAIVCPHPEFERQFSLPHLWVVDTQSSEDPDDTHKAAITDLDPEMWGPLLKCASVLPAGAWYDQEEIYHHLKNIAVNHKDLYERYLYCCDLDESEFPFKLPVVDGLPQVYEVGGVRQWKWHYALGDEARDFLSAERVGEDASQRHLSMLGQIEGFVENPSVFLAAVGSEMENKFLGMEAELLSLAEAYANNEVQVPLDFMEPQYDAIEQRLQAQGGGGGGEAVGQSEQPRAGAEEGRAVEQQQQQQQRPSAGSA
eukprot:TRINITY_DN9183_c0_g3_i1.p1 TRINITY_DN9183_c0_g3~~TRINITY_DN9183_c0_g3_i1.p1  ORF type:complete len:382 (+),score=139.09 TRINITY_DN9183_c0_g3_i1:105-1250(+)